MSLFRTSKVLVVLAAMACSAAPFAPTLAQSLVSANGELATKQPAPPPDGYVVTLREPSVLAFESAQQLTPQGKSLGLKPTKPAAEGFRFEPDAPSVRAYRHYLRTRQDQVLGEMGAIAGKSLAVRHRWDVVGNGFSVAMDADTAARLARHPDVLSVTPDAFMTPDDFATPQTVGAESIWMGVPGFAATRGEGVVIGIIDEGIDAAHPSFAELASDGYRHQNPRSQKFGLCQTIAADRCNNKLIGIYDFVQPMAPLPGDDTNDHGTPVASRAAGNPVTSGLVAPSTTFTTQFSGVAPRANLISYRTNYQIGTTVAAINQAVLDRVDVVNMSFGNDTLETPWQHAFAMAVLQARSAGVVPIASIGNLGPAVATANRSPGYAPWVTSVAANRNNQNLRTRLVDIRGLGDEAPYTLSGEGITAGVAESDLVLADAIVPNTACAAGIPGSSTNPFPIGSLTGKIVVCELGIYTSVEKSLHAKAAGAVGIVLLGNASLGPLTFPPPLHVPGVILGSLDAQRLRRTLDRARVAGQPVRARIDGVELAASPITGLLASYSSRGPVPQYGGVLKPNVAAPGPQTFAAQNNTQGFSEFGGTSSAAPAAAGVAALIKASRPNWTVDQITSAMATTGVHGTDYMGQDQTVAAGPLEDGGGMVNAAAAIKAGLSFAVTELEFRNADPATGGNPEQLNLPALYTRRCMTECTFVRRVTANQGGTWQVFTDFDSRGQITVSPTNLSLAAGQTAEITIRVQLNSGLALKTRLDGEIRLVSGTPEQVPFTRIPITVERGIGDVNATQLGPRPTSGKATFQTSRLTSLDTVRPVVWPLRSMAGRQEFLADGTIRSFMAAPPAELGTRTGVLGKLTIRISSTTAPDIDLYVYEDTDANGSGDTFVCSSTRSDSNDQCELDVIWNGSNRFEYEIRSYDGSPSGDQVQIAVYNEIAGAPSGLVVTAERGKNVADETLPLTFAWDLTRVPVGSDALAYYGLEDASGLLATARVTLERAMTDLPAIVLNGKSDSQIITLEPGQAHERIVVDIAPNQTALVVRTEGTGGNVDLYASRATSAPTPPVFAPAPPRGQQPFVSAGLTNTELLGLEGPQFGTGRYYITPVNNGTTTATITLTTTGLFSGSTVQPAANGYYNPARSGHGVFLARTPQVWALAWYTFDGAGKPIWYTAQGAAAAPNDGMWSAPIYRSTWNGVRDNPQEVGRVMLTFDGTGSFTFSWLLDGQYGSEPFLPIGAPQCANGNLSVGGGWLRPDQPGWGSYFLNFPGNFEAEAIYVYDADGLPRWVIGDGTYATTLQKNLFQVQGFCPTCTAITTTRTQVGTATRTLNSATAGTFSSSLSFADGLSGTWVQSNVAWAKLTPDLACP